MSFFFSSFFLPASCKSLKTIRPPRVDLKSRLVLLQNWFCCWVCCRFEEQVGFVVDLKSKLGFLLVLLQIWGCCWLCCRIGFFLGFEWFPLKSRLGLLQNWFCRCKIFVYHFALKSRLFLSVLDFLFQFFFSYHFLAL